MYKISFKTCTPHHSQTETYKRLVSLEELFKENRRKQPTKKIKTLHKEKKRTKVAWAGWQKGLLFIPLVLLVGENSYYFVLKKGAPHHNAEKKTKKGKKSKKRKKPRKKGMPNQPAQSPQD